MLNQDALIPHRVVEIIDRTFRIYRDNFITFIGIAAVVLVPITLVTTGLTNSLNAELAQQTNNAGFGTTTALPPQFGLIFLVSVVSLILQGVILNGLLTYIASENHLGRKVSVGEAFTAIQSRLVPLGVGLIIYGVLFFVAFVAIGLTSFLLCPLLLLPVVIYLAIAAYYYVVPVLTLENISPTAGLSRALALGKQRFWPAFWLVIGINFILVVIGLVIGLLFGVAASQADTALAFANQGQTTPAAVILQLGINVLVVPIIPIALTLMYYDTRVRNEGLDIALQNVTSPNPRPMDVDAPPTSDAILGGRDLTNIVILTVALVVIFGLSFCTLSTILSPAIDNVFDEIILTLGATPQR